MSVVIVCIVFVAVPIVVVRLMWPDWRYTARVWLTERARPVFSPAQQVSASVLQRRMLRSILSSATVTARGRTCFPPLIPVLVSQQDARRLADVRILIANELAAMLLAEGRKRDWVVPEEVTIDIVPDRGVPDGRPRVAELSERDVGARTRPLRVAPTRTTFDAGGDTVNGVGAADGRPTKPLVVTELVAVDGGSPIDLTDADGVLTIGRADADVVLTDPLVSQRHATLERRRDQWIIRDCGSLNGTWINSERIDEVALIHNDEVSFAASGPRFIFARLSRDLPPVR